MIQIVETTIDTEQLLESVKSPLCGGTVLFLGTTRQFTDGRETARLSYECYEDMAVKKMNELRDEAMKKWPVENCAIVHRIGEVGLGEASIAVAVSTPHRVAAFEAAQWLVDTLKKNVPIWKKEHWVDGSDQWIHPDSEATSSSNEAAS